MNHVERFKTALAEQMINTFQMCRDQFEVICQDQIALDMVFQEEEFCQRPLTKRKKDLEYSIDSAITTFWWIALMFQSSKDPQDLSGITLKIKRAGGKNLARLLEKERSIIEDVV